MRVGDGAVGPPLPTGAELGRWGSGHPHTPARAACKALRARPGPRPTRPRARARPGAVLSEGSVRERRPASHASCAPTSSACRHCGGQLGSIRARPTAHHHAALQPGGVTQLPAMPPAACPGRVPHRCVYPPLLLPAASLSSSPLFSPVFLLQERSAARAQRAQPARARPAHASPRAGSSTKAASEAAANVTQLNSSRTAGSGRGGQRGSSVSQCAAS